MQLRVKVVREDEVEGEGSSERGQRQRVKIPATEDGGDWSEEVQLLGLGLIVL